jgi:hypothetical protein
MDYWLNGDEKMFGFSDQSLAIKTNGSDDGSTKTAWSALTTRAAETAICCRGRLVELGNRRDVPPLPEVYIRDVRAQLHIR